MGCGRVGAALAISLEDRGHTVAVVDQNPAAFRRLPSRFSGEKVTGMGFDRDTLLSARITEAYGFAAVADGDNSNVLAARVVRETFGVANVVARIYDPDRAEVYQRLGIPTVATVRWTTDQVLRRLLPLGNTEEFHDASGQLTLAQVDLHHDWFGRSVHQLETASGVRVAYITRYGQGVVPANSTVLQENDIVHVVMRMADGPAMERILTSAPVTS